MENSLSVLSCALMVPGSCVLEGVFNKILWCMSVWEE